MHFAAVVMMCTLWPITSKGFFNDLDGIDETEVDDGDELVEFFEGFDV